MTENNYERRNALNRLVNYANWVFGYRTDIYDRYASLEESDEVYFIQTYDKQNKLDTETMLFTAKECRKAEEIYRNRNLTVKVWIFTVEELDNYVYSN